MARRCSGRGAIVELRFEVEPRRSCVPRRCHDEVCGRRRLRRSSSADGVEGAAVMGHVDVASGR